MVISEKSTTFLMGNISFQPEIYVFKNFFAAGMAFINDVKKAPDNCQMTERSGASRWYSRTQIFCKFR